MTILTPEHHGDVPPNALHSAIIKQTSPPRRFWPYALLALSPIAAATVFVLTDGPMAAALAGLGLVVIAGLLFRDDGTHEVHVTLTDGGAMVVYQTRSRRRAEQILARLGRSAALTELTLERASRRPRD